MPDRPEPPLNAAPPGGEDCAREQAGGTHSGPEHAGPERFGPDRFGHANPVTPTRHAPNPGREERLAAKLRENLHRRKARTRALSGDPAGDEAASDPATPDAPA